MARGACRLLRMAVLREREMSSGDQQRSTAATDKRDPRNSQKAQRLFGLHGEAGTRPPPPVRLFRGSPSSTNTLPPQT